jgi:hypothetical protein
MIITIDSNLINSRQTDLVLNALEEMAKLGKIKIVGAQRLLDEMKNFNSIAYQKANNYLNISEPFTIGLSAIGSAYIAGDEKKPSFIEIANILFPNYDLDKLTPNQNNDVMHLVAHAHSDSDYFVTRNLKDFIDEKRTNENRGKDLKDIKRCNLKEIGIDVRTPEEILSLLNGK